MSGRRLAAALVAAALLTLAGAASVVAEVVQKGNVRLAVDGSLTPRKLPRAGTAPIAVAVGGKVSSTDGGPPPQLKTMKIELNREGVLDSTGLPVCAYDSIQPASTLRALSACRQALVGRGSFDAEVTLAGQDPYPIKGEVLAFNGREHGKPVLFAQIYAPHPFATSFVIVFAIHGLPKGRYGTALEATLPASLGSWGNLTGIQLRLQRTYSYRGRKRSYLSAGCPAPSGLASVNFALARASFGFDDGHNLSATLNRTCQAKGK